jgi:hypothetical protein
MTAQKIHQQQEQHVSLLRRNIGTAADELKEGSR